MDEALQEVPLHTVDLRRESLTLESVDIYIGRCERGSRHFERGMFLGEWGFSSLRVQQNLSATSKQSKTYYAACYCYLFLSLRFTVTVCLDPVGSGSEFLSVSSAECQFPQRS